MRRLKHKIPTLFLMLLSACGLVKCAPNPITSDEVERRFADALPPIESPASVYFVGHSLVGREMPHFLAQLAPGGHRYESQMGWGAELQSHWEPDVPLNGGDVENDHPRFREAHDAVGSGEYSVLVLTEKVEIKDAVKYHEPWRYLANWAKKAWASNPNTRVYLYETWHQLDDPNGWVARLDNDLSEFWEGEIADRAMAVEGVERPIYMIPAGQVMAAFARALEREGGLDEMTTHHDFFNDMIHPNELGAYLVALTHYAVIYGQSPVGLPHRLTRTDGKEAQAPTAEVARLMQETVWEVVTQYPRTGVRP